MKKVAELDVELTIEERYLLSIAHKNVINAKRAAWRVVMHMENQEDKPNRILKARAYRQKVENELKQVCRDMLKILDNHLIPSSQTGESKVFFYKM